mmetsp:Transcript_16899/g.48553  ORF Transcript_16899/g.48553 Transcript_16899/m.48553 type:complete len:155 (-) Transcript_16899:139-603(-)
MSSSAAYFRIRLALLLVACACVSVQSLVPETKPAAARSEQLSRRGLIRGLSAAALAGNVLLNSQTNRPAFALKPNNDALCGTGFFTNIAQYKCTDIGDISDEGQSRKTTAEEDSRMDSLMSKLGADLSGGAGNESDADAGRKGGKDNEAISNTK